MCALSGQRRIALIDDDPVSRKGVRAVLDREGYATQEFGEGASALDALREEPPDLILLDIYMPGMDGFEVFDHLRKIPPLAETPVVFLTASEDKKTILRIFQVGADDYLGKPIRSFELLARLRLHLDLCLKAATLAEADHEITQLRRKLLTGELEHPEVFEDIVTQSRQMYSIFQYLEAVSSSSRPVLVTGETGTGKELLVRAIHQLSGREGELVAVNVAGLDDNLFSDTLFGHETSTHAGGARARAGMVERANDGTLFLDEIGDLPVPSQMKLLRLLQEQEYFPLGGDRPRHTSARVVVATNQDLEGKMRQGTFRNDLYFRLNTHRVHLPPLRLRKGDIPLLVRKFVADAADSVGMTHPEIEEDVFLMLRQSDFPGNVRELEALVFDAVRSSTDHRITLECFRGLDVSGQNGLDLSTGDAMASALSELDELPSLSTADEALVHAALQRTGGNVTRAAAILGISRQALHKRLKR